MALIYELLPILLFFITFKWVDIYAATLVGMAATALQVLLTRCFKQVWDKKQLITLAVFLVFGGMTIYFHDPIFIKWKPSIVFWLFALVLIISQLFTQKPMMQRLLEPMFEGKADVPVTVWSRINFMWAICFAVLGACNLYIAYHYSNDTWVNFKFYGITSVLFVFSLVQSIYLAVFIKEDKS